MPIFNGTNNIANIYHGNNQILKVFHGSNLKYELSLFGTYELIADVEVTSNTTQIDFDNLNITKDDELRLVYTFASADNTGIAQRIFVNNNTTTSNYYFQQLSGSGSSTFAARVNTTEMIQNINKVSGFADIKVSNNDRFVVQSQFTTSIGSGSSGLANVNRNIVSTFTVSLITKLTIQSTTANNIKAGSRLQLYKVNTGSA